MGGTDDPGNLILLTPDQHAEAHRQLYQEHGKIEDLWASQLLDHAITAAEGFQLILEKNARDTHRKQKERGTGTQNSDMQRSKGYKGAAANRELRTKTFLDPYANPSKRRVSCIACGKETSMPGLSRFHQKCLT